MQKPVEEYLAKASGAALSKELEERRSLLLELGITMREYAPEEQAGPTVEYPQYDDEAKRYFRPTPCNLTEEEWTAVKQAYEKSKPASQSFFSTENKIAFLLTLAGLAIYALALILGFTAGQKISELINDLGRYSGGYIDMQDNSFMVTLVIWVIGFAKGTSLLGISELIKTSKRKS